MEQKKKSRLHVISNTHWDREWRYSVWTGSQMLVELLDRLIELMEKKSEYRHYILDGQSVVVQDYLKIRPQNRERLVKLIKEGRIQVGPWYTLPHQFAVTGESLVRNLLTGIKKSQEYGRVCKVGYTVFSFGQVSQIPQIYAGFDIDSIMTCKRVSKERAPQCEFLWESPDGTRALTTRYGDHGRGNYFYFMVIPVLFGLPLWDTKELRVNPDWCYDYSKGGIPCHIADTSQSYQDTFLLNPPYDWHPELIPQGLKDVQYTTRESSVSSPKLYSESADFCCPTDLSVKIIEEANKHLKDAELIHSSVEDFMSELKQAVDYDKLTVVSGELRDGPAWAVQNNINSAGIPIRLENFKSETHLIRIAEPLASMANTVGLEYPSKILDRAWEYLLKSHAHDSINGYGIRSVWFNTLFRLEQVRDISEIVTTRSIQQIVAKLDSKNDPDDMIFLTVFNTLSSVRDEYVDLVVDLPDEGAVDQLDIIDSDGNEVPYQILDYEKKRVAVISTINRPMPYMAQRFTLKAKFNGLPACGFKTYKVRYKLRKLSSDDGSLAQSLDTGSLLASTDTMENDSLKIKVNSDGTFDLTRKKSGHTFKGLLSFEDRGEVGDATVKQYPLHDDVIISNSAPTVNSVVREGSQCCELKIKKIMTVPANTDRKNQKRSSNKVEIPIEYTIRLCAESEIVEIDLQIENTARNHILSMIFPTFLNTNLTHADSPFDVVTRKLNDRSPNCPSDKGMDEEYCYSFVDINDGQEGLAIFTGGIPTYELRPYSDISLAFVLVRAFDCKVDTGEAVTNAYPQWEHTQVFGKHSYSFAIYPHSRGWQEAKVPEKAARFHTPLKVAQHGKGNGRLPSEKSWLSIEPDVLLLSAFKKKEESNNYIVRFYNPLEEDVAAVINIPVENKRAWLCNMNEERLQELKKEDRQIRINAMKKKVYTIELES